MFLREQTIEKNTGEQMALSSEIKLPQQKYCTTYPTKNKKKQKKQQLRCQEKKRFLELETYLRSFAVHKTP